ncbi:L-arabinose transport system permease protein AraQ [compost metagenome]
MQFIFSWNSFFVPLIFTLNKPELRTLSVGMYSFTGENSIDFTGMAAGAAIAIVPIIIIFILFQRYFVEGIAGSVKG